MGNGDEIRPDDELIREQLTRITASPRFRSRGKPTEVLVTLVECALAGHVPSEKEMSARVFPSPPYKVTASNFRQNTSIVRILLAEYYAEEGMNDSVRIGLPKPPKGWVQASNAAYRVTFAYKSHASDIALFNAAETFLSRYYPAAVIKALGAFETVLSRSPNHHEAQYKKIECLCLIAIYVNDRRNKAEALDEALGMSRVLLEKRPNDWRSYLAAGSVFLCRRDLASAPPMILKGIELLPDRGAAWSLWAPAFFLLQNNYEKAASSCLGIVMERLDDYAAWAIYGFHLYLARKFDDAEEIFNIALTLDPNCWPVRIGLIFLWLATDRPKDAFKLYLELYRFMPDDHTVFMPGLGIFAAHCAFGPEEEMPGEVRVMYDTLLEPDESHRDYIQMALAQLAINRDEAIDGLWAAFLSASPLVLVLRCWPIFDTLREHPKFQALLETVETTKLKPE